MLRPHSFLVLSLVAAGLLLGAGTAVHADTVPTDYSTLAAPTATPSAAPVATVNPGTLATPTPTATASPTPGDLPNTGPSLTLPMGIASLVLIALATAGITARRR